MITTVLRTAGHSNGSGAILAQALGVTNASVDHKRVCHTRRFVINYGVNTEPSKWRQRAIVWSNTPQTVELCRNKAATLKFLAAANVPCVDFLYHPDVENDYVPSLKTWLDEDGKYVARHTLTGHSGAGIEIVRKQDDGTYVHPNAPLYTRYFKKNAEYRVHVFYGRVILIQQKKRDREHDFADNDNLIRTHGNGWVFAINDLSCDRLGYRNRISELAISAATAVGANHCAVDILVKYDRAKTNLAEAVVVEINSAPALRCTASLTAYADAFRAKIREIS